MRMRIVFFGTPDFAVPPLLTLLNSEHEVLAVITRPDKPRGRGRHLISSPVKQEAQKVGLRILQPVNVKEVTFIKELKSLNPSVIIVVAYGQILPSEIIHLPPYGCINLHASLLPKYRGAAPINWAIINEEDKTGVTTMLMDEGMDTGTVLLQVEVKIEEDDTAGSLSDKLSRIGADILIQTLKGLEHGNLKPMPQAGKVSYAPLLKKTDGLIIWNKTASELYNLIRGTNPWPGAYSFLEGGRVKILRAEIIDGDGESGVISEVTKDKLLVGAGKGLISILEIQAEGKSAMPINVFLQGRKIKHGMRFYEKPMD
ncbi:MAG: methionyl-tRNA formyltransferase [Nitrospirae bacterium]|nr:methionyl-tRNA formyltransferase [Nitrospirota bacterium]